MGSHITYLFEAPIAEEHVVEPIRHVSGRRPQSLSISSFKQRRRGHLKDSDNIPNPQSCPARYTSRWELEPSSLLLVSDFQGRYPALIQTDGTEHPKQSKLTDLIFPRSFYAMSPEVSATNSAASHETPVQFPIVSSGTFIYIAFDLPTQVPHCGRSRIDQVIESSQLRVKGLRADEEGCHASRLEASAATPATKADLATQRVRLPCTQRASHAY